MKNACIHIYTGHGKGKTTAAIGLCYRCANRGFRVGITSFLKDFTSGEFLGKPPFTIFYGKPMEGFWINATEQTQAEAKAEAIERLNDIFKTAKDEGYDLITLDEVLDAITVGMINEHDLIKLLKEKPPQLEVVLTGRDPSNELCKLSDYISEIMPVKHPYSRGLPARVGIEY